MDNCIFIDEICKIVLKSFLKTIKIDYSVPYLFLDDAMKKCNKAIKCKKHPKGVCEEWSPLLLIVPLRLGLSEFNSDYKESIKV
jgi:hypothetical protein